MTTPAHVAGRSVASHAKKTGGWLVSSIAERTDAEAAVMTDANVLLVNEGGLAIVQVKGSPEQYPFTFDKIVGYKGQPASEIGLVRNALVKIRLIDGQGIVKVEIPSQEPKP